jgi:hypothetical protein
MTIQEAKQKVVSLARSQVGYHEGANNQNKYADDPRITQLYGWNVQNQPWCCTFVNWCFLNAFGTVGGQMTYGGSAACATQASYYRNHGAFFQSPEVGDQIFFYSGGGINHTGIVVEVNGSAIRTVEGNYSDKVSLCTYVVGNSVIAGYGRPKWSLATGLEDDDYQTADTSSDDYLNALGSIVGAKPVASTNTNVKPSTNNENHDWKPPLLKYDSSYYAAVEVLQSLLTVRNWDCGKIDGYFGAKTQATVNRAKRFYGLDADGVCDEALWNKLRW